jgi:hypothetical protein
VLVAKQEHGSAGGRDVVKEGQESLVGWLAETGVEGSEVFRWCVVEGLPTAGVFEMREGNARSDSEGPGVEDSASAAARTGRCNEAGDAGSPPNKGKIGTEPPSQPSRAGFPRTWPFIHRAPGLKKKLSLGINEPAISFLVCEG